jgi:hypothetical protein
MLKAAKIVLLLLATALAMPLPGRAHDGLNANSTTDSIGVATMSPDGIIRLQLRAEGPGVVGDAVLVYKPGDPMYEEVKQHIGGIKPGEEKPIPPWPTSQMSK